MGDFTGDARAVDRRDRRRRAADRPDRCDQLRDADDRTRHSASHRGRRAQSHRREPAQPDRAVHGRGADLCARRHADRRGDRRDSPARGQRLPSAHHRLRLPRRSGAGRGHSRDGRAHRSDRGAVSGCRCYRASRPLRRSKGAADARARSATVRQSLVVVQFADADWAHHCHRHHLSPNVLRVAERAAVERRPDRRRGLRACLQRQARGVARRERRRLRLGPSRRQTFTSRPSSRIRRAGISRSTPRERTSASSRCMD